MSLLSKPVLVGLLATSVATVLVLLQPDTGDFASVEEDLLPAMRGETRGSGVEALASWHRTIPAVTRSALQYGLAPPPSPPPPPRQPPLVVAPPPRPVAPAIGFSYLGRMVQDEKTYVFLGSGTEVEVVPIGGTTDSNWRIEGFSATGLELRYLPLDEIRQLALSER